MKTRKSVEIAVGIVLVPGILTIRWGEEIEEMRELPGTPKLPKP